MRKAQSAMEYLITYGWAILIMLAVIGMLFYIGIFNPQPPNSCIFQSGGFACVDFKVMGNSTDSLWIDISQSSGHDIVIDKFNCTAQNPLPASMYTVNLPVNITIPAGGHALLNTSPRRYMTCLKSDGSNVTVSDMKSVYKGTLFIEYVDLQTGFSHKVTGSLTATIEPQ